jgi:hypothetical protein
MGSYKEEDEEGEEFAGKGGFLYRGWSRVSQRSFALRYVEGS